ncbi:ABC transporter B family member 3 [Hondaea fermentalgiana]|uniref:ABC transporter B family member 3 n=1 Tax=Hondaea fermentalgiana TaxID=2315210 RepID=A0A2R5G2F3_9STRA|nr:ABC transporter B family member 3 [Hondaea fermentalgiana]|eukprot:GBG24499.1 ABC transporter B family member 3 [Hondaea fermentalgiana]
MGKVKKNSLVPASALPGEGEDLESRKQEEEEEDEDQDETTIDVQTENSGGKNENEDDDDDEKNYGVVSCVKFFRYADSKDYVLILLGLIGGAGLGVAMPLFAIFLGDLFNDFNAAGADIMAAGRKYLMFFGIVGASSFVAGFLQIACFTMASERITLRIRSLYLNAILKQDITWFDKASAKGGLSSSISENTVVIREGILKLGELSQFVCMFIGGFVMGFVQSWQLTLVIVAVTPLLAACGYAMTKLLADATSGGLGAYATAGGMAEEAFTLIRTVTSYSKQRFMLNRYNAELKKAEAIGIRKAHIQGLTLGATLMIMFSAYGLAFWFGSRLVLQARADAAEVFPPSTAVNAACYVGNTIDAATAISLYCQTSDVENDFTFNVAADVCNCLACACGCAATGDCIDGGGVLAAFFGVLIGAMSLGQLAPAYSSLTNGRAAAARIYDIIEREPEIDATGDSGEIPDEIEGALALEDVHFHYPSRPDVKVFRGINLKFAPGTTTALVGGSGCGKSTVTQLLMRFYDPTQGRVTLDGADIRDLNLAWLRNTIGLVSQEPILFATSIYANIVYGAPEGAEVTHEEVVAATKAANAYDFIMELTDGFDSYVGEGGSTLSGGQKQRIAIARALVRNPQLLILDEATSALDSESERVVQAALDDLLASQHRTTIVIAHRLTTVRDADNIIVMGEGEGMLEQGTHDQLVAKKGHYFALLSAAKRSEHHGDEDDEEGDSFDQELEHDNEADRLHSESRIGSSSVVSTKRGGADAGNEKEDDDEPSVSVPLRRILAFSAPEKLLYIPAVLASAANGALMPMFSLVFVELANVYYYPTSAQIKEEARTYALYFVAIAVASFVMNYVQLSFFGIISERMTLRIRSSLFESMLKQDIGFFDAKKNSVGALAARLSTDAALVKASLADRAALTVQNLVTIALTFALAFSYTWRLTLVLLALFPLLVIGGGLQFAVMTTFAKQDEAALAEAGQVLQESISGIRTVTAFSLRKRVVSLYDSFLDGPTRLAVRKGLLAGLGMGFSQGVIFCIYGIAFYYTAVLIETQGFVFSELLRAVFLLLFAGVSAGQAGAMAPDVGKASAAASSVFSVLDRKSGIDPFSEDGLREEAATSGDIVFDKVNFAYPTRPDVPVLENVSLTIPQGKHIAFVGMSGSGKSTTLANIERFYDVQSGSVRFHGIDVKEANVGWLRSRMAYVEQEPKLINGTILENITFGLPDDACVSDDEIQEVARDANALGFIRDLPDDFVTLVNGSSLSGGQKQRVCIARALLRARRADVILLDEATAALDNVSERFVQNSLERLMEHRNVTTITVAHKLKTIERSDIIFVVHHGNIVEKGTHKELLGKNGPYAKLYRAQRHKR